MQNENEFNDLEKYVIQIKSVFHYLKDIDFYDLVEHYVNVKSGQRIGYTPKSNKIIFGVDLADQLSVEECNNIIDVGNKLDLFIKKIIDSGKDDLSGSFQERFFSEMSDATNKFQA